MTATNALGVWTSEGPTLASILGELPGVPVIDRSSMNAFEVIEWYFTEVPKVSKSVGVDVREKANATA